MPHAIDEDLEKGSKGLVVLLPEMQGAKREELPGFMYSHWPKWQARVCAGGSFPLPESPGLPHGDLIGVDGTLLWDGHPGDKSKLDKLVAAELDKVQKGWGPTAEAKKFRALLFGKLNLVEAKKLLDSASGMDQELKKQLESELALVRTTRTKGVKFLIDDGRYTDAKALLKKLDAGTKGNAEWEAEVDALTKSLDAPDLQKEIAAEKKLVDTLKRLVDKQLKGVEVKTFEALAKSVAGTKAAARAQEIAAGVGKPPDR